MFFKIDNSSENNCFTSKEMQFRGFRSLITFITFEYLNSHNVTIEMYTICIYIAGLYDFFSTINYGGFKICVATWGYSLHTTSVFGLSRSSHSHHLLSRQSRAPFRCCAGLFPGSQAFRDVSCPLFVLTQSWHVCVLWSLDPQNCRRHHLLVHCLPQCIPKSQKQQNLTL